MKDGTERPDYVSMDRLQILRQTAQQITEMTPGFFEVKDRVRATTHQFDLWRN